MFFLDIIYLPAELEKQFKAYILLLFEITKFD